MSYAYLQLCWTKKISYGFEGYFDVKKRRSGLEGHFYVSNMHWKSDSLL